MNTKFYLLILSICSWVIILQAQTYDARIGEKEILTPLSGPQPVINGPKIYGVRPGREFVYRIPCQGERPMEFQVNGLPEGLTVDVRNGIILGQSPAKEGDYKMELIATNAHGTCTREFKLVVGDKIALTPPTGWNSWGGHMLFVSDRLIREVADIFVEKGFADAGYQYIGIDDCWMRVNEGKYELMDETQKKKHAGYPYGEGIVGGERDKKGNIVPNRFFPDMKAMTDYIHSFGLKVGLYSSPGPYTCQGFEGSFQHEALDADQYAAWGFDLLKYDLCSGSIVLNALLEKDKNFQGKDFWEPMVKFINDQNRDILFNLCQYGKDDPWEWAPKLGIQTWRIGGDLNHNVGDYFEQALRIANELREYSKPGQWNDPDFMYIHKIRDYRAMGEPSLEIPLNTNQRYQYVTLWSIVAAPFFFSCDMEEIDDFTVRLLTNAEVLNINQDEKGDVGRVIKNEKKHLIITKDIVDGSKALAIFNRDSENEVIIQLKWEELGIRNERYVHDVWRQKDLGVKKDGLAVKLSPDGVAYFIVKGYR